MFSISTNASDTNRVRVFALRENFTYHTVRFRFHFLSFFVFVLCFGPLAFSSPPRRDRSRSKLSNNIAQVNATTIVDRALDNETSTLIYARKKKWSFLRQPTHRRQRWNATLDAVPMNRDRVSSIPCDDLRGQCCSKITKHYGEQQVFALLGSLDVDRLRIFFLYFDPIPTRESKRVFSTR